MSGVIPPLLHCAFMEWTGQLCTLNTAKSWKTITWEAEFVECDGNCFLQTKQNRVGWNTRCAAINQFAGSQGELLLSYKWGWRTAACRNSNYSRAYGMASTSRIFIIFLLLIVSLEAHKLRKSHARTHTAYKTHDNLSYKKVILGKWPTWRTIHLYVFIYILNSLHVSSTSCWSSGETSCVNTTSDSCRWPCRVQVGHGHWQLPEVVLTQFVSPDDQHDVL